VDADGWRLAYSHWGAQTVDVDLAPGPGYARRFVESQAPADPQDGWLDDRWAEGAALLDFGRRELLFFGASEYMCTLAYRRAHAALLAETWPGWTVRWAYDELGDLVAHVGVDLGVVRVPELVPDADAFTGASLAPATDEDLRGGYWVLVTVRTADGVVTGYALDTHYLEHLVWAGERLLDLLPDATVREVAGLPPGRGLHVDVPARAAGWWTAETAPAAAAEAPARWPGWRLTHWDEGGYERQLAACEGAVRAPAVDLAAGFDELEANLVRERREPVASFEWSTDRLRAKGHEVTVTAPVSAHRAVEPGDAETRDLFAALARARRAATG
jgi:hypothetical protein